jgi:5'-3' exonuclease
MTQMRKLAIDFSSFAWTALLAGKDLENGRKVFFKDREVLVNSAGYGYEIIMNMFVSLLKETGHQPIDTLFVFEGKSSKSKRSALDSTYKDGGQPSHPAEAYVEFQALSDQIRKVWKDVGATCLTQDFAEGDDTLAWLAREWPGQLTIATYDNDISALNTEDGEANAYGGTCQVWVGGKVGMNKYGAFDFRRIRIYKALVGDSSDGVKGAAGFGPAAFDKLVTEAGWDGIDELEEMLTAGDLGPLHALAEESTVLGKLVKKIVDSSESVIKAWKVVKLYPEWVNTMRSPLQIVAGKVSDTPLERDSRLEGWYGETHLITDSNYEYALETVEALADKGPFVALDIETSTSDASDEWLLRCNDPGGVDTLDSKLTGFSLTFGKNLNMNVYVSVNHSGTDNIKMSQARKLMEKVWASGKEVVVHNAAFELPVLYLAEDEDGAKWSELWKDNGYRGFVPRVLDSKISASYENENVRLGLKGRCLHHFGVEQTSYAETTTKKGVKVALPRGGRLVKEWDVTEEGQEPVTFQERQ